MSDEPSISEAKRHFDNAKYYVKLALKELEKGRLETDKLHKFIVDVDKDITEAELEIEE